MSQRQHSLFVFTFVAICASAAAVGCGSAKGTADGGTGGGIGGSGIGGASGGTGTGGGAGVSGAAGASGGAGTSGAGGASGAAGTTGTGGSGAVTCGMATCGTGQICCNASCGVCTAPGAVCTTKVCTELTWYQTCGRTTVCTATPPPDDAGSSLPPCTSDQKLNGACPTLGLMCDPRDNTCGIMLVCSTEPSLCPF